MSKAWQSRSGGLVLALALSLPAGASAQEPEPGAAPPAEASKASEERPQERSVITPFETPSTRARVVSRPSSDQAAALYPGEASRRNVGGKATVECEIARSQRLVNCVVTEETPKGLGFGPSLLKLAALYRVAPPTYDDQIVDGVKFTIPMTFVAGPPIAAPSRTPPVERAPAERAAEPGADGAAAVTVPEPPKDETPEERLKRLGPLKRSDGVLWAPIAFAIVVLVGLGRALLPVRRGRRVNRPADQRA